MSGTRRKFLCGTVGAMTAATLSTSTWTPRASAKAREGTPGIRIGGCTVGLEDGLRSGLEGVEVRVGGPADRLEISRPDVRRRYKEQMQKTGLPISSLMMALLNDCPLATDPRAPGWLEQSIEAAQDLGAKVILMGFFFNGDLLGPDGRLKPGDVDPVVARLKAAAPRARDAGVILGIENYVNAEQNARILDRIGHDSVKIYYDCFNTGGTKGYDVPAEIRLLKDRIVQFHFKNGPDFLETGKLHYPPIAAAIKEIGYRGWIVLETSNPTGNAAADVKRNADYVRELFA